MASYPNFYETVKEANMRLRNTVVMYEGEPYFVYAITDHKRDGIFRIYMEALPTDNTTTLYANSLNNPIRDYLTGYSAGSSELGKALDKFMDSTEDHRLVRKYMTAGGFNKFRPFPLGFVNTPKTSVFSERTPTRKSEQGLTATMLILKDASLSPRGVDSRNFMTTARFRDMLLNKYPTASEVLAELKSGEVEARAFHRNFCFSLGPCNIPFFVYKNDLVGFLPDGDLSCLQLEETQIFLKEAIQELNIFSEVR